ncbi:hypothetical protein LEP1GSC056_3956 [Leptospira borgpetersenii str. Brem 328]|nr:hypothetical protein LEP1GSC056_3956 [Leptospira borgpetersenii str. Brem 328]
MKQTYYGILFMHLSSKHRHIFADENYGGTFRNKKNPITIEMIERKLF